MPSAEFSEMMGGRKQRIRRDIPAEEFVKVWQSSSNVAEVSEKLGIPKQYCMARASSYRHLGVNLKHMPRGGTKLDIVKLNSIIEAAGGGDGRLAESTLVEAAEEVTPKVEEDIEKRSAKTTHKKRIRSII